MIDDMQDLAVPFICPECDHSQWIQADNDLGKQDVTCKQCGKTNPLRPE